MARRSQFPYTQLTRTKASVELKSHGTVDTTMSFTIFWQRRGNTMHWRMRNDFFSVTISKSFQKCLFAKVVGFPCGFYSFLFLCELLFSFVCLATNLRHRHCALKLFLCFCVFCFVLFFSFQIRVSIFFFACTKSHVNVGVDGNVVLNVNAVCWRTFTFLMRLQTTIHTHIYAFTMLIAHVLLPHVKND